MTRKTRDDFRADGLATRELLIDTAGEMAAERGWSAVLAKDVCEKAGVNRAMINYCFGSRDGLYREVAKRIPEALMQESAFEMPFDPERPDESLEKLLDTVLTKLWSDPSWPTKLWVREVVSTSDEGFEELSGIGARRVGNLRRFFAAYYGLEPADPVVSSAIFQTMIPIFFSMVMNGRLRERLFPDAAVNPAPHREAMKRQLMAGFRAERERLRAR